MPDTFDREAIVELARTNVVKATRMAKEAGAPLEFFIGPQSGTFSVTPKNTTREVGPGVTQDDGHPEQAKVQDRPSLEVIKERVRKLTMPEQIGDAATKLGAVLTPGLLDPDKPTPDQETPPAEPAVPSNKPVPKTSGALKRPIVIPRDYLALPWKSLQNLAGRISGEKPASRNDALAIIEAYAAEKQK
jgi:hypothetical protein